MPAAAASWDGYDGQIFPAADMCGNQQWTLEAVLRQRVTAPPPRQQDHQSAVVAHESSIRDLAAPAATHNGGGAAVARKRPLRTDRHSKIRTARGVRDRRIRLSVGVSREFFPLQDRLGFDKGSKTIKWLLVQSRPAIDRLFAATSTVPGAAPFGQPPVVVGKGEGSSTTTGCFRDTNGRVRNRGVLDDAPAAVMDDRCSSELDWVMPQAAATAAAATTVPMAGLEYYQYQY